MRGFLRFAELRRRVFGIAPNILSHRLKRLQRHGIVERRFYSEHPPRAEYTLTRRGHELGVVAGALAVWGRKHLSDRGALVHEPCGTPIRVGYYCPACDRALPGAEVRLVEGSNLAGPLVAARRRTTSGQAPGRRHAIRRAYDGAGCNCTVARYTLVLR